MLTFADLKTEAYSYLLLADTGATATQDAVFVTCCNRALEKMRETSPQSFRQTIGITWTAARTGTANVTAGSRSATLSFSDVAAGSSVNIAGDTSYNEIVSATGAVVTLLHPYGGTTNAAAGLTAYGDSVVLDSDAVDHVTGCELLHEKLPLVVLNNREEWLRWQAAYYGWGSDYWSAYNTTLPNIIRQPGVPRGMWLETVYTADGIEYRAHCAPLPNAAYRADLDVCTMAAEIALGDLSDSGTLTITGTLTPDITGQDFLLSGVNAAEGGQVFTRTKSPVMVNFFSGGSWFIFPPGSSDGWFLVTADNSTPAGTYLAAGAATGTATVAVSAATTRPVPGGRTYGILRALVLYYWSAAAWFRDTQARAIIQAEYLDAIRQLEGFRPSASRVMRSKISYTG